MKKYSIITISALALFAFMGCDNPPFVKKQTNRVSSEYLLYLARTGQTRGIGTPEAKACNTVVFNLNTCVGDGNGFDPGIVCAPGKIVGGGGTYTLAMFQALNNCVLAMTNATSCNLTTNKAPNAQTALYGTGLSTPGIFQACNNGTYTYKDSTGATQTLPSGMLQATPISGL